MEIDIPIKLEAILSLQQQKNWNEVETTVSASVKKYKIQYILKIPSGLKWR